MSTIYVFEQEVSAVATVATDDVVLLHDTSAGTKKKATVANVYAGMLASGGQLGNAATDLVGFYGKTAIAQPASASQAAITAGATTTAHKTLTIALRKALVDLGLIKGAV